MNKLEQKVLVVPTDRFFPDGIWEGFRESDQVPEVFEVIRKHGEYRKRGEVEEDGSWQQIIPQIVLIVGEKLFVHRIPVTGSEERLHDLWPIFLGGHVEESDLDISQAAEREFREELGYLGSVTKREFVGVVNLQDNPVNSVHAGLVWAFIGDSEMYEDARDDGVASGRFVTWEEAEEMRGKMSYWSKEAFPALRRRFERTTIL